MDKLTLFTLAVISLPALIVGFLFFLLLRRKPTVERKKTTVPHVRTFATCLREYQFTPGQVAAWLESAAEFGNLSTSVNAIYMVAAEVDKESPNRGEHGLRVGETLLALLWESSAPAEDKAVVGDDIAQRKYYLQRYPPKVVYEAARQYLKR